jgi:hypothetical protein
VGTAEQPKKFYAMKSLFKLVFLFMLIMASVQSCQKEESSNLHLLNEQSGLIKNNIALNLSINEASTIFESIKSTSSLGDNNCIILPKLSIVPDWSKSKQHKFEKFSVVETPIFLDNNTLGMVLHPRGVSSKNKIDGVSSEIASYLITSKDDIGQVTSKIMLISSSAECQKVKNIKNYSYRSIDKNFCGMVSYYNLDGSFHIGWKYKDGKVISKIAEITNNVQIGM